MHLLVLTSYVIAQCTVVDDLELNNAVSLKTEESSSIISISYSRRLTVEDDVHMDRESNPAPHCWVFHVISNTVMIRMMMMMIIMSYIEWLSLVWFLYGNIMFVLHPFDSSPLFSDNILGVNRELPVHYRACPSCVYTKKCWRQVLCFSLWRDMGHGRDTWIQNIHWAMEVML